MANLQQSHIFRRHDPPEHRAGQMLHKCARESHTGVVRTLISRAQTLIVGTPTTLLQTLSCRRSNQLLRRYPAQGSHVRFPMKPFSVFVALLYAVTRDATVPCNACAASTAMVGISVTETVGTDCH